MFKAEDFSAKTLDQVKDIIFPIGDEIIKKIVELSDDPKIIELDNVVEHSPLTIAERLYCSALGYALFSRPGVTPEDKMGHADCFMSGLGFEALTNGKP